LAGLNELDAKYKYIQLCQNLKTYGVTFFLVKVNNEQKKAKNIETLFYRCILTVLIYVRYIESSYIYRTRKRE